MMNSSISYSSAMLRLQGFFLAFYFFFFPLLSARREEVETSIDTDDDTDDSREPSLGRVGDLVAGHFAERHFAERTFCRMDILPNGHFAENRDLSLSLKWTILPMPSP
jgi:hypothetical protein